MTEAPPTLSVSNLSCERGGRRVFTDLTFTAEPGSCIELRGPNGSGKSSLLRLLAGLGTPATGTIAIGSMIYVGHLDAVKPALTVRENLGFWSKLSGSGTIDDALEAFTLRALADEQAAILSQGQRRRLALSRLALAPHSVWLLDEPTVGLDDQSLDRLRTIISTQLRANGIVVAATHVGLGVPVSQTLTLGARA
jgi:heme exporter protein A